MAISKESMAGEVWNRVNIPFPSAVSSVRVHFSSTTDAIVKNLWNENETVLQLMLSEILQTEIRVLYELLYNLNNSTRGTKTFKVLKQVEQCINRLKNMKLSVALQELTELCPTKAQRALGIKAQECDVPSQPFLEWLCLKVLGAAQLMSCTLSRCSRAFLLSKQHMKLEEFLVLNMVITSMLSRLWVIFRGILVSLCTLYQQILTLLREVAEAQPMPYLTDFSLPADMTQFLGLSDAFLLSRQSTDIKKQKKRPAGNVKNSRQKGNFKEDLGVAIERGVDLDAHLKPFVKAFRNFTQSTSSTQKMTQRFKKQVRSASTFADMATHLDEMIQWCRAHKMGKERRLLNFLRLKCQKMKCLEEEGYNIRRQLQVFRQEACWASSPRGSMPRTCRSSAATRRNARLSTRFHSLRSQHKFSVARAGVQKKRPKRQRKRTKASVSGAARRNRTSCRGRSKITYHGSCDDIDDIFAAIGL